MTNRINNITANISSQNTDQLKAALAEVSTLSDLSSEEKQELAAAISTTFYRDPGDDAELSQLIDQSESVLASLGAEVAAFSEWYHVIFVRLNRLCIFRSRIFTPVESLVLVHH